MPYFTNCPRCNADNKYDKLGTGADLSNSCPKCSGTGRDWRNDNELESYHSWANLGIDDLRSRLTHVVERNGSTVYFTYRDAVPRYSIKKEIEEIRKELKIDEAPYVSQIFCTHSWTPKFSSNEESCAKCGKIRVLQASEDQVKLDFQYNKLLHDTIKFFPNRCYACEEYANTTSPNGNPLSGDDLIFCNIGGSVRADEGCKHFKPDNTAECDSCWNFSRNKNGEAYHCDIQGRLTNMAWGSCPYHVEKERRD